MNMSLLPKVLLIVAAMGLAACNNPNRYGAGSGSGSGADGQGGSGLGGDGVSTSGLGDPNNPASVAYFNATVGDRVHFELEEHTLTDEARSILDGQAGWLLANPDYAIIVEGHADEQGTMDHNLALSARRAESVKNYLIAKGVSGGRIQTIPYGKLRPIALCSDESCYAQNRRAVTVLSLGAGA